jgi:hypothetical protein
MVNSSSHDNLKQEDVDDDEIVEDKILLQFEQADVDTLK